MEYWLNLLMDDMKVNGNGNKLNSMFKTKPKLRLGHILT